MDGVALMLRLIAERLVRWPMHARIRPVLLRALGSRIGSGVRIDEVMFINLSSGFSHLVVGDESYIGAGSIIDLLGTVEIGSHTAISPGCVLMTHSDPGSTFGNELARRYPRTIGAIRIGNHTWIGSRTTILQGVTIGDQVVVGSGAVVTKSIASGAVAYGVPAVPVSRLSDVAQ